MLGYFESTIIAAKGRTEHERSADEEQERSTHATGEMRPMWIGL